MHVANFRNNRTGVFTSPTLGNALRLFESARNQTTYEATVIAALFAFGLYHLIIFGLRRDFYGHFALGLSCWCLALFFSTLGTATIHIAFPQLDWEVMGKLTFAGWAIASPMSIILLSEVSPRLE